MRKLTQMIDLWEISSGYSALFNIIKYTLKQQFLDMTSTVSTKKVLSLQDKLFDTYQTMKAFNKHYEQLYPLLGRWLWWNRSLWLNLYRIDFLFVLRKSYHSNNKHHSIAEGNPDSSIPTFPPLFSTLQSQSSTWTRWWWGIEAFALLLEFLHLIIMKPWVPTHSKVMVRLA